jgi:hypothetical protein
MAGVWVPVVEFVVLNKAVEVGDGIGCAYCASSAGSVVTLIGLLQAEIKSTDNESAMNDLNMSHFPFL